MHLTSWSICQSNPQGHISPCNTLFTLYWLFVVCQKHYYQPMLTLIGGGLRSLSEAYRPMKEVLSPNCDWIQDSATRFDPDSSQLTTRTGFVVRYWSELWRGSSLAKECCYEWVVCTRAYLSNNTSKLSKIGNCIAKVRFTIPLPCRLKTT